LLETRTEGSKEADTGANTKARMPTDESGRVSRQVPTAQASPREEREVRETKEKDRPSEASSLSSASVAAVPADSSAERGIPQYRIISKPLTSLVLKIVP